MDQILPGREEINEFFEIIINIFDARLFTLANKEISLWSLIAFIFSIIILLYVATTIRNVLENKILTRYKLDIGVRQSIATIVRYVILIIGFIVIVQTAGIDLTALGLLAGAVGVGIGFGLQNITNNFISGIIILFERPIKVGDRIEVASVRGDVVKISARATTVVTNDNISIIVPNSDFISSTVTNWSHNDRLVRFNFPVGVSYNEDPENIKKILLEVATDNKGVLKNPAPDVLFDEFGDSSLNFNLRVWTSQYTDRPNVLKSQLYYSIFSKFKQNNIQIPFPQRDLHIISGLHDKKEGDKNEAQIPR
ncbi:MAG: mechanosensitive ion channel [Bacteroidota bacterium]|jgi:small-conductance mechanosensitive channel|nr:mechanosensitive ion channel [Bacteroidota bacterium]